MAETHSLTSKEGSKNALREQAKEHRKNLKVDPDEVERATTLFFDSFDVEPGITVAAYWPKGDEFDTRYIIADLAKKGIDCALPVIEKGNKRLRFVLWKEGDPLEAKYFGVEQPVVDDGAQWVDPDIVIVPLLAFDRNGYRLGYGGGYYDATLKELRDRKAIQAVGVGYGMQICLFPLPHEPHDEKLDYVITPEQIFAFTSEGNQNTVSEG